MAFSDKRRAAAGKKISIAFPRAKAANLAITTAGTPLSNPYKRSLFLTAAAADSIFGPVVGIIAITLTAGHLPPK